MAHKEHTDLFIDREDSAKVFGKLTLRYKIFAPEAKDILVKLLTGSVTVNYIDKISLR